MCTGDNIDTAKAISLNAGILKPSDPSSSCMTGKEFREAIGGLIKNDDSTEGVRYLEKFKEIKQELRVLARSSPDDKYLLVSAL